MQSIRLLKYVILIHIFLVACTKHSQEAEPVAVYAKFIEASRSPENIYSTTIFMSKKYSAKTKQYIENLISRGKTEEEIYERFISASKHHEKCTKNLKVIKTIKEENKAKVFYSFDDVCTAEMVKNEPEKYKHSVLSVGKVVNFVYEDGWKIENSEFITEKSAIKLNEI